MQEGWTETRARMRATAPIRKMHAALILRGLIICSSSLQTLIYSLGSCADNFCRLVGFLFITSYLLTHSDALSPRETVTPMAVPYHQQKSSVNTALPVFGLRHPVSIIAVFTTLDAASLVTFKLSGLPAISLATPKLLSCIRLWVSTSQTPASVVIPASRKLRCKTGDLNAHAVSVLIDQQPRCKPYSIGPLFSMI